MSDDSDGPADPPRQDVESIDDFLAAGAKRALADAKAGRSIGGAAKPKRKFAGMRKLCRKRKSP